MKTFDEDEEFVFHEIHVVIWPVAEVKKGTKTLKTMLERGGIHTKFGVGDRRLISPDGTGHGYQMSEMGHALHCVSLPVIDFKTLQARPTCMW